MTSKWLGEKKSWFKRPASDPPRPIEKTYSVAEVAELFSVEKKTIYKWLIVDEYSGDAIIPLKAWFKLPASGHIRIRAWIIEELMQEGK